MFTNIYYVLASIYIIMSGECINVSFVYSCRNSQLCSFSNMAGKLISLIQPTETMLNVIELSFSK